MKHLPTCKASLLTFSDSRYGRRARSAKGLLYLWRSALKQCRQDELHQASYAQQEALLAFASLVVTQRFIEKKKRAPYTRKAQLPLPFLSQG